MTIWNLDEKIHSNEHTRYMAQHGYDKGHNDNYAVGEVITFWTGYNNDIRAQASIKGINGNDLYVYNDCYWFPIQDTKERAISKTA